MQTMKKSLRAIGCVCVLALVLALLPATAHAETNKEKLERLRRELDELSASIAEQEKAIENASALLGQYQQEKALIEELLEANRLAIEETQREVDAKQGEIAEKRESIAQNQELFESRLVAIYKMNNAGLLSTLLGVDSYSDLLSVSNYLSTISQHDTQLLDNMRAERQRLEEDLAELDSLLADQQARNDELNELVDYYAQNIQRQNQSISDAQALRDAQEAVYGDTYEEYQRVRQAEAAAQSTINNTGSNSNDGSQYEGGVFQWPVGGFYNVSCEYGAPDPDGRGHRGMDISGGGIQGAPITAVADGTVIVAVYGHYSWGNYIVVDHGGGLKSLYAHCESLAVTGGSVSRGQTIGYVGSTGFSTGYHLHLEVTQDGVLQNPRNYF